LATALFCCDQQARVVSAQSSGLWQQATIEILQRNHSSRTLVILFSLFHKLVSVEIPQHNHSITACSRHIYMGVGLCAHPIRGETFNATPVERLPQRLKTFFIKILQCMFKKMKKGHRSH